MSMSVFGWYLMMPPTSTKPPAPETLPPLCNGTSSHVYDSAALCEKTLADLKAEKRAALSNGVGLWNSGSEESAQCIATDDPRLKCGQ
jgi:hypothetical protein